MDDARPRLFCYPPCSDHEVVRVPLVELPAYTDRPALTNEAAVEMLSCPACSVDALCHAHARRPSR